MDTYEDDLLGALTISDPHFEITSLPLLQKIIVSGLKT